MQPHTELNIRQHPTACSPQATPRHYPTQHRLRRTLTARERHLPSTAAIPTLCPGPQPPTRHSRRSKRHPPALRPTPYTYPPGMPSKGHPSAPQPTLMLSIPQTVLPPTPMASPLQTPTELLLPPTRTPMLPATPMAVAARLRPTLVPPPTLTQTLHIRLRLVQALALLRTPTQVPPPCTPLLLPPPLPLISLPLQATLQPIPLTRLPPPHLATLQRPTPPPPTIQAASRPRRHPFQPTPVVHPLHQHLLHTPSHPQGILLLAEQARAAMAGPRLHCWIACQV